MNLDTLSVQRYKEVRGERKERENTVQRSIATATAASLARLVKIETSKGLETAVSLGQQRMHGCSKQDAKKSLTEGRRAQHRFS